jgi:hypothetical protein
LAAVDASLAGLVRAPIDAIVRERILEQTLSSLMEVEMSLRKVYDDLVNLNAAKVSAQD